MGKEKVVLFLAYSLGSNIKCTSYNFRDVFELCRYRVANLTSCSEFMSGSDPIVKNHIEFQWRSKLLGTSLEALENPHKNLQFL